MKSHSLSFTLVSRAQESHTIMDSSWPENLSADRKKAIQELIRGRESAKQLRVILGKPFVDDGSMAAQDLVMKILGSFTETISILNLTTTDEVSQIPANTQFGSPYWDGRKSEDSEESSKTSVLKGRRGSYKRRKTSQARIAVTPNLIDDGHAWRKYGQKVILNAKHPRNYFRCTHKFDQGCQATKQVQKTEADPPMYRTTYHGYHTCRNLLKAPPHQIILDSIPKELSSPVLLNFGTNSTTTKSDDHAFFPSFPLIKQEEEYKEEKPSNLNHHHQHQHHNQSSSSSDYLLSADLKTFESSELMMTTVLSSGTSDHGDVISSGMYSCTASPHSPSCCLENMDVMVEAVDFDDVLQLDFDY